MIKDFTFICICYNQMNYITEHLESIKEIITKYGSEINNHLIVADDCSNDDTVRLAEEWVSNNSSLFYDAKVLTSSHNLGTIRNIYRAIDECKTNEFKILAGDDKYYPSDIYKLYDGMSDEIVITPIIPFGVFEDQYKQLIISFRRSYRLLIDYNKRRSVGELLLCQNFILAPGAFVPSDYWRNEELRNYLMMFKYVEDIPMWLHLIIQWKKQIRFVSVPYVYYRISATQMLNGSRGMDIRKPDINKLRDIYPNRPNTFRKKIRLFYFRFLFRKLCMSYYTGYDEFFSENPIVKIIYIDSIK